MLIDTPDRARRLARTIVSDIALYNKDEIGYLNIVHADQNRLINLSN